MENAGMLHARLLQNFKAVSEELSTKGKLGSNEDGFSYNANWNVLSFFPRLCRNVIIL